MSIGDQPTYHPFTFPYQPVGWYTPTLSPQQLCDHCYCIDEPNGFRGDCFPTLTWNKDKPHKQCCKCGCVMANERIVEMVKSLCPSE